ncbi:hypothetical protein GMA11_04330 [Granulicatella sp. zg-ZJ]|uniref:hypothetical protein n=1 Tax=Granulicatella sp. zg-ZJ TaxID=2678504 RepID=UPI0013D06EB2|nr:hypothetical protein [Granulicatella sp. zg-ZJ]NEW62616.1 hypothetical protein [Granulicatella sp. zg-ZJ]
MTKKRKKKYGEKRLLRTMKKDKYISNVLRELADDLETSEYNDFERYEPYILHFRNRENDIRVHLELTTITTEDTEEK